MSGLISRKNTTKIRLGPRLHELRAVKGLNQTELTNMLDIPRTTYRTWERGEYLPSCEMLIRIADFYCVSLDYLLCRTDRRGPVKK